jgi:hypothetical protein
MALAIGFLISFTKYLLATPETKLYKARLLFIVVFRALIHVLLSASNMFNANIVY